MEWDSLSVEAWAACLGMASAPLFGTNRARDGEHTVFLDGHAASFAMLIGDGPYLLEERLPLSWSWSSNLRHLLVVDKTNFTLHLRQWDTPEEPQRMRLPRSPSEAEQIVETIGKLRRPKSVDVVTRMIATFKGLRATLSSYGVTNLDVIKTFNAIIAIAEQETGLKHLESFVRVGQIMDRCPDLDLRDSLAKYKDAHIGDVLYDFVNSSPSGVPPIDANLLLRHASGELYQEAHFELERQSIIQSTLFGGREPNLTSHGRAPRDARLTPPELARTLIEQSLKHLERPQVFRILDPACGSGVFLQEALRALESQGYQGKVVLTGFDSSAVSVEIARFCMAHSIKDAESAGISVSLKVSQVDSLKHDWECQDLILMNPPFASYKDMDGSDREASKAILGELAKGHFDKSMAFVQKAISSVTGAGVIASVLPSSLMDSNHGERWRCSLLQEADLRCIGRFGGYGYFSGAMVEPAFVILKKHGGSSTIRSSPLTIISADEGAEESSMRALRKGSPWTDNTEGGFFISLDFDRNRITSTSWMPKSYRHESLLRALSALPVVDELFDVNQGALTGKNDVFLLSSDEWSALPYSEVGYFRPAAGTKTIKRGKLSRDQYVFYPYGSSVIETEEDLKNAVPVFFDSRLKGATSQLKKRRGKEDKWWTLTEFRSWQTSTKPKIVSAYFGTAGSVAFDETGAFVCLHGYAWNRREEQISEYESSEGESDLEEVPFSFYDTNLPFAYIAILNSRPFEVLLSCFCTRVAGGQFNLSKRYVRSIPIPDLAEQVPGDIVNELAEIGVQFSHGMSVNHERLSAVVSRAYGVPLAAWGLESA